MTDENISFTMSCGILAFARVPFIRKWCFRRTIWLRSILLKSEWVSGSFHFHSMYATDVEIISSLYHNHTSMNSSISWHCCTDMIDFGGVAAVFWIYGEGKCFRFGIFSPFSHVGWYYWSAPFPNEFLRSQWLSQALCLHNAKGVNRLLEAFFLSLKVDGYLIGCHKDLAAEAAWWQQLYTKTSAANLCSAGAESVLHFSSSSMDTLRSPGAHMLSGSGFSF